jgi:uncharacterized protein
LCRLGDVTEVEAVLTQLAQREDGPYVVRLPREPGKRESRYAHLFSGEVTGNEVQGAEGSVDPDEKHGGGCGSLGKLEQRVADLEAEVVALKMLIEGLGSHTEGISD